MKFFVLVTIAICVFSSCSTYSDEMKTSFNSKAEKLAQKKGWNVQETGSGLLMEQLIKGEGEDSIQAGSVVKLSYTGKLSNGYLFDQTTANKPLESKLNGLIMGFQEGLLGQKKGAKLRLVIPPQMGYGDKVLDKIPANSILFFEIEVLEFI